MRSQLSYYLMLARRWAWVVVLGVIICGGATYIVSKRIPPVYQASTVLLVNIVTPTSAFDSVNASQLATPTYAQLLTSPQVLRPVLAQHPGLTLNQLNGMVTAKPQPNTSLIEIDVDNSNPDLAAGLANEVARSFVYYANTQLLGTVEILPAEKPTDTIKPKPLQYASIGALVGLGLALSLVVIFEWIDDRLARPEEVQELLGMEVLTVISRHSRKQCKRNIEELPAFKEDCRMLCASLNAAQAVKPFKLVMVTSALPGEGKSTIAATLASLLAMAGKRVLLVDADLRHPTLDQHFQLDNRQGLSNAFLEMGTQQHAQLGGQETDIPMLRVLTAGTPPPNPAELLQMPVANQLFDHFARSPFDYVIFDTSPLLSVADVQILASLIQATVWVIDASKTPRRVLRRAKHVFSRTRVLTLGIVINKSPWPEYSDRRQYLSYIRQPGAKFTATVPPSTPSTNGVADTAIPVTPYTVTQTLKSEVDPNITLRVPRKQQGGNEKS